MIRSNEPDEASNARNGNTVIKIKIKMFPHKTGAAYHPNDPCLVLVRKHHPGHLHRA